MMCGRNKKRAPDFTVGLLLEPFSSVLIKRSPPRPGLSAEPGISAATNPLLIIMMLWSFGLCKKTTKIGVQMLGLCCTQNKIEVEGGPQELAKPQIKI
jgi:hypothetical protein